MGRKKRGNKQVIFCYYCDRTFTDEKSLIEHQKSKHFRCTTCNRKLNAAGALYVHCEQVHKTQLKQIPAAIEGRQTFDVEVYGMQHVPQQAIVDYMESHGMGDQVQQVAKKARPTSMGPSAAALAAQTFGAPHAGGYGLPPVAPAMQMGYGMPPQGYGMPYAPQHGQYPGMPPAGYGGYPPHGMPHPGYGGYPGHMAHPQMPMPGGGMHMPPVAPTHMPGQYVPPAAPAPAPAAPPVAAAAPAPAAPAAPAPSAPAAAPAPATTPAVDAAAGEPPASHYGEHAVRVPDAILVYGDGLMSPEERRAAARTAPAAALAQLEGGLAGRLEEVLGKGE